MTVIAIVTSTKNGGIGMNDSLPWINLYSVREAYDELAPRSVILVGGASFNKHEHIKGEKTYVYAPGEDFHTSEKIATISGKPEDVIAKIKEENPESNILIAGGASVFNMFFDFIDEWRVMYVNEPTVFNKEINMTNIRYIWKNHRLISSGYDNNKEIEIWHYTK